MKIIYEQHPVSPERKAELRAQGFKIIDARFAPEQPTEMPSRTDIARMKKAEVIEYLEAHGVEGAEGSITELREMLAKIMFVEA